MKSEVRHQLDSTQDPLLCRLELPLRSVLYPLGFPAILDTNSADVQETMRESWGRFEQAFDTNPVHLSVVVSADESDGELPPPVFRCRRHVLSVVTDRSNYAVCDMAAGFTTAWITQRTAKNRLYLRDAFTDAPVYSMLHAQHLSAIHAACVSCDGVGVLLCGDSGAGKTSLAISCALNGWRLISDDASYLIRRLGGHAVIGNPYELRFKRDAVKLFPMLEQRAALNRLNGKPTIFVRPEDFPGIRTELRAEVSYLIFLRRTEGAKPTLSSLKGDILQRLRMPGYGEERVLAEREACLGNLADLPSFEFTYSDLQAAVECLQQMIHAKGLA